MMNLIEEELSAKNPEKSTKLKDGILGKTEQKRKREVRFNNS